MKAPLKYIGIVKRFSNKHHGIDFGWWTRDKYQNVYAVADGKIIYNRHQITGGYVIHELIETNTGYYVAEYGHLLKDSQTVKEGMLVKKGQKIAKMGASGIVTGVHLHFGLYKGKSINYSDKSKWLDPLKYINVYDSQKISNDDKNLIKHTKHAENIPSEPLNIRYKNKNGKVVGHIYNGDEVENFGLNSEGWNIVDNLNDYVCSNKYLK